MISIIFVANAHITSIASATSRLREFYSGNVEIFQIYPQQVQDGIVSLSDFRELLRNSDAVLLDIRGTGIVNEIIEQELNGKNTLVINMLPRQGNLQDLTRIGRFSWADIQKGSKQKNLKNLFISDNPQHMLKSIQHAGDEMPESEYWRNDLDDYVSICKYWINGGEDNLYNLLLMVLRRVSPLSDLPLPNPPIEYPSIGIYYPSYGYYRSSEDFFADLPPDPGKKTIGFLFHGAMHLEQILPTLEKFISCFSDHNIIPVYCFEDSLTAINTFFRNEERVFVDAVINLRWFRIGMSTGGDPGATHNLLKELNVPVFSPVCMFNQEIADWEDNLSGLDPLLSVMSIMWPESDGCIESIPCCGLVDKTIDGVQVKAVVPIEERVEKIGERIKQRILLKTKKNSEKKLAFIIYNSPPGEGTVGGGYLDVSASMTALLSHLAGEGYSVEIPDKNLAKIFEEQAILNLGEWYDIEKIADSCIKYDEDKYLQYFNSLPEKLREDVTGEWGIPPGSVMNSDAGIIIPGMCFGNIFIGLQPARPSKSCMDPGQAYHDQNTPPHHQYLAFYSWLRDEFNADAIIHVATHGSAEFTKGKEIGLSSNCFPDLLIGEKPHFYFYHLANTAEASIAKRRMHATMISYNSPPFTISELYDEYKNLELLLNEYDEASLLKESGRVSILEEKILALVEELNISTTDVYTIHDELTVMKRTIIPCGMHILGQEYTEDQILQTLCCILRIDHKEIPSIYRLVAEGMNLEYTNVLNEPGRYSLELESIDDKVKNFVSLILKTGDITDVDLSLFKDAGYIHEISPHILALSENIRINSQELINFSKALDCGFVPTRLGGDVIRNPSVLPTGANIHQFDPCSVPTDTAIERGRQIAKNTIAYCQEKGVKIPESVGLVLWGFETTKTGGETVGQILEYLGLKVKRTRFSFNPELEVIPLSELGHPRIDCHVSISGIFRDTFPTVIQLIDKAFKMISGLDEPAEENFIKKHTVNNYCRLEGDIEEGLLTESQAREIASGRIYGPRSGGYGTGLLPVLEDGGWKDESELAGLYEQSMNHLYTEGFHGIPQSGQFNDSISKIELLSQVRDSSDIDIIDLDHYFEFFGGLSKTVETRTGNKPVLLISDTSSEIIRTDDLEDVISRAVRTRLLNPKWIEGLLAHDYHGGQSIGERVHNLLGLAATTNSVEEWVWSAISELYVFDEDLFQRMQDNNQFAMKNILDRLFEAAQRDYWTPSEEDYDKLLSAYLELEGNIEG